MLSEFATGETNSKDERGGELIFFGMKDRGVRSSGVCG